MMRGTSSGWTSSSELRPTRRAGSAPVTQAAEALIHPVVMLGSSSETDIVGERSSARSRRAATSAGMAPTPGSSDSAVINPSPLSSPVAPSVGRRASP
jgi:hypothetical protein